MPCTCSLELINGNHRTLSVKRLQKKSQLMHFRTGNLSKMTYVTLFCNMQKQKKKVNKIQRQKRKNLANASRKRVTDILKHKLQIAVRSACLLIKMFKCNIR